MLNEQSRHLQNATQTQSKNSQELFTSNSECNIEFVQQQQHAMHGSNMLPKGTQWGGWSGWRGKWLGQSTIAATAAAAAAKTPIKATMAVQLRLLLRRPCC